MEEETDLSIWQKHQSDLTVGESTEIAVGVGVALTVIPIVIFGIIGGVGRLVEIYRTRKAAKLELVNNEENN